jgi:oligopeptide/dipeptide ABC transporter ATP-binding protein
MTDAERVVSRANLQEVGPPPEPPGEPETLLEIRRLSKLFPIRGSDKVVQACSDITLTVRRGETLGVIGESGSGKTTLGRCVLRLTEPTSGQILFEGLDLAQFGQRRLREARKAMQIVFQEPFDSLNPQMTVGRQITEPLRIHTKLSRPERIERARELLGQVGLPPSAIDMLPRTLSPGAQQRVSIARAIATNPKLIVLDEPTSALSPEAETEVIALLQDLQHRLGLTYVFISHDLDLVKSVCDHVAVMYLSQVVELGDREAVFGNPRHPYSRALLASVLVPDIPSAAGRVRKERLKGEIPSPIDLPLGCYLASRCPHVVDRCRAEHQELETVAPGHEARCWRARDGEI